MDMSELLIKAYDLLDDAQVEDGIGRKDAAYKYLGELYDLLDDIVGSKVRTKTKKSSMEVSCYILNVIFFKVPAVHGSESGKWWAAELQDKNIPIRWDEKSGEFRPDN